MNSSGHRAIILSASYNRVGIGAFKSDGSQYPKKYYTGVFSHGCGSTATPTPTRPRRPARPRAPRRRPPRSRRRSPRLSRRQHRIRPDGDAARDAQADAGTPQPTPRETDEPDDTPRPTDTPEPTAEPTPGPVDPAADNNQPWLELILDDGYTGIGVDGLVDVPTPGPVLETLPPPSEAPPPPGPSTGDGDTLQVLEPPSSQGLLDTIVGDVVASFLGK